MRQQPDDEKPRGPSTRAPEPHPEAKPKPAPWRPLLTEIEDESGRYEVYSCPPAAEEDRP